MTAPSPAGRPATRRRRGPRAPQTLAQRHTRRQQRYAERMREATTPDAQVAAAALYVRGVLPDLPPGTAALLAKNTAATLERLVEGLGLPTVPVNRKQRP